MNAFGGLLPVVVIFLQFCIAVFGYLSTDLWKKGKVKYLFVAITFSLACAQVALWKRSSNTPAPVPITKCDVGLGMLCPGGDAELQHVISTLKEKGVRRDLGSNRFDFVDGKDFALQADMPVERYLFDKISWEVGLFREAVKTNQDLPVPDRIYKFESRLNPTEATESKHHLCYAPYSNEFQIFTTEKNLDLGSQSLRLTNVNDLKHGAVYVRPIISRAIFDSQRIPSVEVDKFRQNLYAGWLILTLTNGFTIPLFHDQFHRFIDHDGNPWFFVNLDEISSTAIFKPEFP